MRRSHRGRGCGHCAAGCMGGLSRGARLPYGWKRAAAYLQLFIVALLAEKPSHGDEPIAALEERSGGFSCPSPGMASSTLLGLGACTHTYMLKTRGRKRDVKRAHQAQPSHVGLVSGTERVGGT